MTEWKYPDDPTWWRRVACAEGLCSAAGFGPSTTEFVCQSITGDVNEKKILRCANFSLMNIFDEPLDALVYEYNQDLDRFVWIWVMLRRSCDETCPSPFSQKEAKTFLNRLLRQDLLENEDLGQYTVAATAFSRPEKENASGINPSSAVLSTLLRQHNDYNGQKFLAPYSTIVGPSGIGKSFCVRQIAVKHGVFVAYSNFASPESMAYPRPIHMGRTPMRKTSIPAVHLWIEYIKRQLDLVAACRAMDITPAGLFELLTSSELALSRVRAQLQQHFDQEEMDNIKTRDLLASAKAKLTALGLNGAPGSPLQINRPPPVFLCFDESRALLDGVDNSVFRALRRAAKTVAARGPAGTPPAFFVVLLDITSKISNFAPPGQFDTSAKSLNVGIFPPIYTIDSFNLFSAPLPQLQDPTGTSEAVVQLLAHGRPLWGAFLDAGYSWAYVLELAMNKIRAQKDEFTYRISLLTYRLNFYVCSSVLAESMVAASMRFLLSVSEDRNNLVTTQASEPVLALAASHLLQDSALRRAAVRAWITALRAGTVSTGDIGEQVAALILLFASDYVAEPWRLLGPAASAAHDPAMIPAENVAPASVPFQAFLTALLGDRAVDHLKTLRIGTTDTIFRQGQVFFNHVVRLTTKPALAVLEAAYKRGAAVFLPTNFPGMDLGIPIRMPGGHMALLFVQIKNRQDETLTRGLRQYMEDALEKAEKALGLSDELQGILGLVMCLRSSAQPYFASLAPKTPARKQKPARLLGISFGLDASVFPCMRATSATTGQGNQENADDSQAMEDICVQLANLLERWPNAYAEDTQTSYAQALLNPICL